MKKMLIYMASAFFSFNLAAAALPLNNGEFDSGGRGWKLCRMSKVSDNDGNKVLLINDNDPKKGSSVWSSSLKIKGVAYYKIAFRARSLQAGEKRGIAGLYVRFFARDGKALYFSRAPIPFHRDPGERLYHGHIGLYAFRMDILKKFVQLGPSRLEGIEKLEQLRLMENGIPIHVVETEHESIGVDRPEDLEIVSRILSAKPD